MRSHPRIDANHTDIVAALRAAGRGVLSLASLGRGCPDLIIGIAASRCDCGRMHLCPHSGRRFPERSNLLMEVKTAKGTVTEDQQEFYDTWPGKMVIVRTLDEALRAAGVQ